MTSPPTSHPTARLSLTPYPADPNRRPTHPSLLQVREALAHKVSRERIGAELEGMLHGERLRGGKGWWRDGCLMEPLCHLTLLLLHA